MLKVQLMSSLIIMCTYSTDALIHNMLGFIAFLPTFKIKPLKKHTFMMKIVWVSSSFGL